jgi:hypothetical protein
MSVNNERETVYDFIDRNDQQMCFPVVGTTFFTFAQLWKPRYISREDPLLRRLELDGWRPFDTACIIGVPGMFNYVMVITGHAPSLSCSSANL